MCKLTGFIMGLTILLGVTARDAGAATLSEMRMVNASQKPGMVIICSRTSEIPQKGELPRSYRKSPQGRGTAERR